MSAVAVYHRVEYYGPGELPAAYVRGSMFLTSGDSGISRAIQAVQGLRSPACYARWNHGGLITHEHGQMVESLEFGPEVEHMEKYRGAWVAIVVPEIHPRDLEQLETYVESVLAADWGYSYLSILCILISLLTGSKLNFSRTATIICTGFNCDGYTRLGYVWPKPAAFMRPDDVAAFFGARFPAGA
ncbi:hypothetical protein GBA65_14810 [Rubrobacter marinus]|uniref:Uncharacterized protein n=1 Tax=Rubrobacter marinus TaxID=2653852 RepID=A0A6G8PZN4_9ACTN|nr:hypothetical protein [Rubrobacter marinus]QIN79577.1 hypothetical protein GBA65_14810 [Rubrobacter marinus]